MLARRLQRDVKERGRSVTGILDQLSLSQHLVGFAYSITSVSRYLRFVKPSYDNFVRPTASYADIVSYLFTQHLRPLLVLSLDCPRLK